MPVIFQHDFEDNSLATWTDLGSVVPTIVTSPVYEGARSLRSNTVAQQVRLQKTFTAGNTFGLKFAVRRIAAADESAIVFRIQNAAIDRAVQIQNSTSTFLLRYNAGAGDVTADTGPSFPQNQWFLLDIKVNVSANPWVFEWKVDGVDQGQSLPAAAATTLDRIDIGVFGFNMNWESAMDKIMVSDEFAYIPDAAAPTLYTSIPMRASS